MSRRARDRSAVGITVGAIAGAVWALAVLGAQAETLESALVQAYQNNPTLNSQRASVRATDEGVPQALSGYRPKVSITASGGQQSLSTTSRVVSGASSASAGGASDTPARIFTQSGSNTPISTGATITQTIFN
ncbi:MAG: TolC family protein, partial [Deltaproteobacteria bacterium]|nr:TolC family protein [Deltaproteobacteria bacterium]